MQMLEEAGGVLQGSLQSKMQNFSELHLAIKFGD